MVMLKLYFGSDIGFKNAALVDLYGHRRRIEDW